MGRELGSATMCSGSLVTSSNSKAGYTMQERGPTLALILGQSTDVFDVSIVRENRASDLQLLAGLIKYAEERGSFILAPNYSWHREICFAKEKMSNGINAMYKQI